MRWALPEGLGAILVLGPTLLVLFAALMVALQLSDGDERILEAFWVTVRRTARIGRRVTLPSFLSFGGQR